MIEVRIEEAQGWQECIIMLSNNNNVNYVMKEMLYEVRCLKSNEDMILALAGQLKQLSH